MIKVANITKYFGSKRALNNVSFEIAQGEIVGFLGPNGAGKTTLMRILTSYLFVSSGKVTIADHDLSQNSIAARKIIGYLPETPPLYEDMSVRDYLTFAGQLKGMRRRELELRLPRVLEECTIEDVQHKSIGVLSKGYKQRIGIAQAIIHNPKILILDEPTSGLDPLQILQVRNLIRDIEKKRTVLLSTHILSEIEQIAHRVLIIRDGSIVTDDSLDNLLKTGRKLEEIFLSLTSREILD